MRDVQTEDLLPGRLNINAYQGDDFSRNRNVKNDVGTFLALSDAKMHIKTEAGTLIKALTVGSGITITNPGVLLLTISKADMAAMSATVYVYDLQVTFTATGLERTILAGLFIVTAQRTI